MKFELNWKVFEVFFFKKICLCSPLYLIVVSEGYFFKDAKSPIKIVIKDQSFAQDLKKPKR